MPQPNQNNSQVINKQQEQNQGEEHNEQNQQNQQNQQNKQESNELSEADREAYNLIFQSITKIGKKVNKAKGKMNNTAHQSKNANFKQIAQKLIQAKENSQIINKDDLSSDISQSYERAVVEIYTENQKLKKKIQEMSLIIRQQNHKIFTHVQKQEKLTKQIQGLHQQLTKNKDQRVINGRLGNSGDRVQNSNAKNSNPVNNQSQAQKTKTQTKNQNDQDYDFWSMPQNDHGKNKKKQFVQNSGLWVNQNQKNIGDSMFITQTKRAK